MTDKKAKSKGYTHKGEMYGIPIYLNDEECPDIEPKNILWDMYWHILVFIDLNLFQNTDSFMIDKIEEL